MSVSSPPKAEIEHADETSDDHTSWVLTASTSWLPGARYRVASKAGNDIVKIGRADHCDINLPGTHLARVHAELRVEPHHLYVKDKGSVTGTYINDTRVTEGIVRPGDRLRLDIYSFIVEAPKSAQYQDSGNEAAKVPLAHANAGSAEGADDALTSVESADSEGRIKPWVSAIGPLDELEAPATQPRSGLTELYFFAGALLVAVGVLAAYLLLT